MADFYEDRGMKGWLEEVTHDMVLAGQEKTNEFTELWSSGVSQTYNNQRTTADVLNGDVDIQVNYAWPAMMQETAIQSQRRPLIMVEPHDEQPEDSEDAETWQGILQHQFLNELGMPKLNNRASIDAFLFGIYIAKVYWEERAEWDLKNRAWIGKPQANLLFPLYFGADPEAEAIDSSTSYLYSGRRVAVDWVLNRWGKGEMRDKILKAAEEDPYNTNYARMMHSGRSKLFTPSAGAVSEASQTTGFQTDTGNDLNMLPSRGRLVDLINSARGLGSTEDTRNYSGQPKHLTLFEVFFRDLTEGQKTDVETIPTEELEGDGVIERGENGAWILVDAEPFKKSAPHLKEGDIVLNAHMPTRTGKELEPTFPRGRFVLKIGKDLILNPKEPDQVWPYTKWPYITGVYHGLPHMWQGLNGTEMSENLQTMINASYTAMLNWVRYFGNPQTVQDPSKLLDENKGITRDPGAVVNTKPGQINEAVKRIENPSSLAGLPQLIQMLSNEAQGQTGKHDQALGRGSKGDQTAFEIATKQESDVVRSSLQIQHRDAWNKEIMELVVEMDQANLEEGQIVKMTGKDFAARNGEITRELLELEFAIKLQIGTGLPFDKEKKKQDWERLAALFGPIPIARELLEAFEVDNIDEILEKVELYPQFLAFVEEQRRVAEEQEQEIEAAIEAE